MQHSVTKDCFGLPAVSCGLVSSHSIRVIDIRPAGDLKIALIRAWQEVDEVLPESKLSIIRTDFRLCWTEDIGLMALTDIYLLTHPHTIISRHIWRKSSREQGGATIAICKVNSSHEQHHSNDYNINNISWIYIRSCAGTYTIHYSNYINHIKQIRGGLTGLLCFLPAIVRLDKVSGNESYFSPWVHITHPPPPPWPRASFSFE